MLVSTAMKYQPGRGCPVLTLVVPELGDSIPMVNFLRFDMMTDKYIDILSTELESPPSYAAPEQYHLWVIPEGMQK